MIETSSTAFKAIVTALFLTALAASRFSLSEVSQEIALVHLLKTKPLLAARQEASL
jgi:hypothetical protein